MFRYLPLCLLLLAACTSTRAPAPRAEPLAAAQRAQETLDQEYLDPERSILSEAQRTALQEGGGLSFFPLSTAYIVSARLERYPDPEVISLPTSADVSAEYYVYGRLIFELRGQPDTLDVFRTTRTQLPEEYRNLLFLPFRDATSGVDTYGGGRYLDLHLPEAEQVTLDFNKAYHPYCAYTTGYACPVPPSQNYVDQRVEAGVRNTDPGD